MHILIIKIISYSILDTLRKECSKLDECNYFKLGLYKNLLFWFI